MGSLTDYSELKLLDHTFENTAYTPVATLYLALFTADPTDTGSLTNEVSGNNYARSTIAFSAATTRKVVQNGQVTFNQAIGGGWGTSTHWGIIDASTSGNMVAHGAFSSSIVIVEGNVPFVPNLEVEISINSGAASDYFAHKLLDFMFRNQAFSQPDCHVAFADDTIVDADTGSTISELSGNGYTRVDFADWTTAAAGALANNTDIDFPTPTGSAWNTITYSAILDASSLGNLLVFATATPNQAPGVGDPVKFVAGAYDVTLA